MFNNIIGLLIASTSLLLPVVNAEVLLRGTTSADTGKPLSFELTATNRQEPVGGQIRLGEQTFTIERESRLGLFGAKRTPATENSAEYAVFSSSFSTRTAVGIPWVAAKTPLNCDQNYNSFLVIYRIDGAAAIAQLDEIPYKALTDNLANSSDSTVYCFMSKPPE